MTRCMSNWRRKRIVEHTTERPLLQRYGKEVRIWHKRACQRVTTWPWIERGTFLLQAQPMLMIHKSRRVNHFATRSDKLDTQEKYIGMTQLGSNGQRENHIALCSYSWTLMYTAMESETDQLKKRDLPYISDAAWSRTPCTTLHSTILLQQFAVPMARTWISRIWFHVASFKQTSCISPNT